MILLIFTRKLNANDTRNACVVDKTYLRTHIQMMRWNGMIQNGLLPIYNHLQFNTQLDALTHHSSYNLQFRYYICTYNDDEIHYSASIFIFIFEITLTLFYANEPFEKRDTHALIAPQLKSSCCIGLWLVFHLLMSPNKTKNWRLQCDYSMEWNQNRYRLDVRRRNKIWNGIVYFFIFFFFLRNWATTATLIDRNK